MVEARQQGAAGAGGGAASAAAGGGDEYAAADNEAACDEDGRQEEAGGVAYQQAHPFNAALDAASAVQAYVRAGLPVPREVIEAAGYGSGGGSLSSSLSSAGGEGQAGRGGFPGPGVADLLAASASANQSSLPSASSTEGAGAANTSTGHGFAPTSAGATAGEQAAKAAAKRKRPPRKPKPKPEVALPGGGVDADAMGDSNVQYGGLTASDAIVTPPFNPKRACLLGWPPAGVQHQLANPLASAATVYSQFDRGLAGTDGAAGYGTIPGAEGSLPSSNSGGSSISGGPVSAFFDNQWSTVQQPSNTNILLGPAHGRWAGGGNDTGAAGATLRPQVHIGPGILPTVGSDGALMFPGMAVTGDAAVQQQQPSIADGSMHHRRRMSGLDSASPGTHQAALHLMMSASGDGAAPHVAALQQQQHQDAKPTNGPATSPIDSEGSTSAAAASGGSGDGGRAIRGSPGTEDYAVTALTTMTGAAGSDAAAMVPGQGGIAALAMHQRSAPALAFPTGAAGSGVGASLAGVPTIPFALLPLSAPPGPGSVMYMVDEQGNKIPMTFSSVVGGQPVLQHAGIPAASGRQHQQRPAASVHRPARSKNLHVDIIPSLDGGGTTSSGAVQQGRGMDVDAAAAGPVGPAPLSLLSTGSSAGGSVATAAAAAGAAVGGCTAPSMLTPALQGLISGGGSGLSGGGGDAGRRIGSFGSPALADATGAGPACTQRAAPRNGNHKYKQRQPSAVALPSPSVSPASLPAAGMGSFLSRLQLGLGAGSRLYLLSPIQQEQGSTDAGNMRSLWSGDDEEDAGGVGVGFAVGDGMSGVPAPPGEPHRSSSSDDSAVTAHYPGSSNGSGGHGDRLDEDELEAGGAHAAASTAVRPRAGSTGSDGRRVARSSMALLSSSPPSAILRHSLESARSIGGGSLGTLLGTTGSGLPSSSWPPGHRFPFSSPAGSMTMSSARDRADVGAPAAGAAGGAGAAAGGSGIPPLPATLQGLQSPLPLQFLSSQPPRAPRIAGRDDGHGASKAATAEDSKVDSSAGGLGLQLEAQPSPPSPPSAVQRTSATPVKAETRSHDSRSSGSSASALGLDAIACITRRKPDGPQSQLRELVLRSRLPAGTGASCRTLQARPPADVSVGESTESSADAAIPKPLESPAINDAMLATKL